MKSPVSPIISSLGLQLRAFDFQSDKRRAQQREDRSLVKAIHMYLLPHVDRVHIYWHIMQFVEMDLDTVIEQVVSAKVKEIEVGARSKAKEDQGYFRDGDDNDDDDDNDDNDDIDETTSSCSDISYESEDFQLDHRPNVEPWRCFVKLLFGYFSNQNVKKQSSFFLYPSWNMTQHPMTILKKYDQWLTSGEMYRIANCFPLKSIHRLRVTGSGRTRLLPTMEALAHNSHLATLIVEQQMPLDCFLSIFVQQNLDLAYFLENLQVLSLNHSRWVSTSLLAKMLVATKQLHTFRFLASPSIDNQFCTMLARVHTLRSLDLTGCRFMEVNTLQLLLTLLSKLRRLCLQRTNVKGNDLCSLAHHRSLTEINLSRTNVDDTTVSKCILPNRSLRRIIVNETPHITPQGWNDLFSHPTLTSISASDNYDTMRHTVHTSLFSQVAADSPMATLHLLNVDLSVSTFASLGSLQHLRHLSCSFFNSEDMDNSLQHVSRCTQLTSLDISLNNIPNDLILKHITQLVHLTDLNLQGNSITDRTVLEICDKMPMLKCLSIDSICQANTLHSMLLRSRSLEQLCMVQFGEGISSIDKRFFMSSCSFDVFVENP